MPGTWWNHQLAACPETMAASAFKAAAARWPGVAATTGTSPAALAASAGSFPTRRRTSNSDRRTRASSSARIPIPAIFGRMGSGARMTTRRVTGAKRSCGERRSSAAHLFEEQVKLPRAGAVNLREQSFQPLDLRVGPGHLPRVIFVARKQLRHPPMNDLVFREEPVSLQGEVVGADLHRQAPLLLQLLG